MGNVSSLQPKPTQPRDYWAEFAELYGSDPAFVVRAPGRVNLIGEHTDYTDGFAFPAAIDRDVVIAGSPRDDLQIRIYSHTFGDSSTFSLAQITRTASHGWSNYVRGVASVLLTKGFPLRGANLVVTGSVPMGSGLSSSAALETAVCLALECAGGFTVEPVQRALLCQQAEREFVGVQCGIMDQFISALGQADHALLIDTRSLEYRAVPLHGPGISLVIADSRKQRGLVDSEYNARRAECSQATVAIQREYPNVKALRDVSPEQLLSTRSDMPDVVFKRARHVVSENARVLAGVDALTADNVLEFGRLMRLSHESLRDDYEVSCRELDVLAEAAWEAPGVIGSRMTGAGFGGCTISLVRDVHLGEFQRAVTARYSSVFGVAPLFLTCRAAPGASRIL